MSAVAMERKGIITERGDEQRGVQARNRERRELTQQLRDLSATIAETMRGIGDKAKDVAQGLRDRLVAPVQPVVMKQAAESRRNVYPRVSVHRTGFYYQDTEIWVF